MAGFTLRDSTLLYPAAGFDPDEDHFGVMLDDQEVGTIYRIAEEWLWLINLGMMGSSSGRAASRREAREAFRAGRDAKAAGSAQATSPARRRLREVS